MIEPLRSAQIYLEALCDMFGESLNAIVSKSISNIECDRNSLAATIGTFLGIYRNGRVPRKYKCIDFVKAFGITDNYDEEYVYGAPTLEARSVWERVLIPTLEDLLGESQQVLHKFIAKQLQDPYKAIETFSENRYKDPRLEKFEIFLKGDEIHVKLCYKPKDLVEALSKIKYGGINSGVIASAISVIKGGRGAKFEKTIKDEGCIIIVFKVL